MPVGLIISLGGSPEPIARTILEHQPQIVCYLASQQSVFILGDLKKIVQDQGITVPDSRVVLLDDANYLVHCFEKALECAKHLEEKHVPPDNVIVDYTGGTKKHDCGPGARDGTKRLFIFLCGRNGTEQE